MMKSAQQRIKKTKSHESLNGLESRQSRVVVPASGLWGSSSQDFVRAAYLLYEHSANYARSNDGNVSIYALPGIPMLFSAVRCLLIELQAGLYGGSPNDEALEKIANTSNDFHFILQHYPITKPLREDIELLVQVRHEIIHPAHRPTGSPMNTPRYLQILRDRTLLQSTNDDKGDYMWIGQLQSHCLFTWSFQTVEGIVEILIREHDVKTVAPVGLLDSYRHYRRIVSSTARP
jgi:hypothetical protein